MSQMPSFTFEKRSSVQPASPRRHQGAVLLALLASLASEVGVFVVMSSFGKRHRRGVGC
jgi:hypothetical protein